MLTQTGRTLPRSINRLLSTICWQLAGERHYALEGSVFVAGSLIQWLRDDLGLIDALGRDRASGAQCSRQRRRLCGPCFVRPWRAALATRRPRRDRTASAFPPKKAHIARAALEAMAHQTHDLKTAFAADGADWAELRVDGGMTSNDWMVQDLADILEIEVERPAFVETTALGAAMLAGVGAGFYASLDAASAMRGPVERFRPDMAADVRTQRLDRWAHALANVL